MELSRAMDLSKEACVHEKKRLEENRLKEEAQHQAALSAVHQKISERKQKMLETLTPEPDVSLKPFVLLFDEYYTDLYRMSEAEDWMQDAQHATSRSHCFRHRLPR